MTQRTNPDGADLLTPGEAALIVGVTVRTIHRYGTAGRLPFVELPFGHRRYRRDDVNALLIVREPAA